MSQLFFQVMKLLYLSFIFCKKFQILLNHLFIFNIKMSSKLKKINIKNDIYQIYKKSKNIF